MPEPEQGIEPGDDAMSLNPGSGGVLGRIVLLCGAITAGTGALVLVEWVIGSEALTSMGTRFMFMAPNTALLFALLGSAVLVREVWPASRGIHRAAAAAALLSAAVAGVTLIGFVTGLNIDGWLFRTTRMLGAVPIGHMSPVTAFCFVLAGVSLLLLECQARTWAAILGTVIMLVGAVCLMGYWFGAPLLYGGSVIPVALPTSLALVGLGVGLTAAAGPDAWPINTLIGPSTRARLLRALLPTVVLLALINSWITAVLLENSNPGIVLASAMTAISFLLAVGFVVSWVSRAIGDAIDRTEAELTHTVEALRQSEKHYRIIGETIPYGVWLTDPSGYCTYVSDSFLELVGMTMEQVQKFGWLHLLPPEDVEPTKEHWFHCVQTGEDFEREHRFRAKDGSYRNVLAIGRPTKNEHGEIVTWVGINLDITERKQAEETLREASQRLKFHVENSPLAVVEFDREFRVVFWSNVAQRVFGWSAKEILGKRIDQLRWVHEEDAAKVAALSADMAAGCCTRNVHTNRNYCKDGSVITCEWYNSSLFDSAGNLVSVLSLVVDITEHKRSEQALHDNAKRLRNLSRRLMAVEETERRTINRELHDRVGSCLSALNLNLSILRSQLPRESLRAVGARLDDTQRLLEETTTHVRDLMADLHPPALDDYGLLAALRAHVESLGARFDVPISVHGETFVPRLPLAVETALFRVAQGALVNAIMHAQAKRIEIRLAASADRVALTIADDGIGFDVAHTSMAHASWGLAIMRERAEAVGATLTVEAAPGKGTRVCVEISRKKR